MTVVALVSAKGAPGVTTAVAALAMVWPRPLLVVEADPSGNDLAARFGARSDPGLVSLAARARHQLGPDELGAHVQTVPGAAHARILYGPASAEQTGAALAAVRVHLAAVLATFEGVDVLVDCGRLDAGSPALELVRAASLTLVVARNGPVDLMHASHRVAALPAARAGEVAVLLAGDRPYGPTEVADSLGVRCLGPLAHDERAARALAGEVTLRRLDRTALLRTARAVVATLVPASAPADLVPSPSPHPPVGSTGVPTGASPPGSAVRASPGVPHPAPAPGPSPGGRPVAPGPPGSKRSPFARIEARRGPVRSRRSSADSARRWPTPSSSGCASTRRPAGPGWDPSTSASTVGR